MMGSALSTRPPSSANDKRLQYIVGGGFCAPVGRHNGVSNAVRDAHAGHHQAGHRDSSSWMGLFDFLNGIIYISNLPYAQRSTVNYYLSLARCGWTALLDLGIQRRHTNHHPRHPHDRTNRKTEWLPPPIRALTKLNELEADFHILIWPIPY